MSEKKNECPIASSKKTSIGGQALMEGIMMRGPETTAMAVRNAKGEIILEKFDTQKSESKIKKVPFVRGIFNMVSSFTLGYKCLMRSADIAISDADEEDKRIAAEKAAKKKAKKNKKTGINTDTSEDADKETSSDSATEVAASEATVPTETVATEIPAAEASAPEAAPEAAPAEASKPTEEKKKNSFLTTVVMVFGVVLGIGISLLLFFFLPSYCFELLAYIAKFDLETPSYAMNLFRSFFEGLLKILIMLVYMLIVSRIKDIKRVFMYHGAEHKTIFCYEKGLDLTVDNIRGQSRFHPRCGTSFLILVLLVSIFIGFFIPHTLPSWLRAVIKIALLPLTVGIGYELIKLAGRKDNLFTRITSAPGVWLQHITTVEPDDSMIECAIAAMNEVIPEDREKDNW